MVCLLMLGAQQLHSQVYLNYTVNQPAALSANAGPDQLICPGDPANLGGNPAAQGGYGGYSYSWTPTLGVTNPTAANPTATPSQNTLYILQTIDSMGCQAFDSISIAIDTCIGIGAVAGVQTFDVFPNPNEGKFTVSIDLATQLDALTLRVTDLSGRSVFSKTLQQPGMSIREQITLSGMSRGAYFIRIEGDGLQLSRKMIIR